MMFVPYDFQKKLRELITKHGDKSDYELECKIKYSTKLDMLAFESKNFESKKTKKFYTDLPQVYFDRAMKFLLSQEKLKPIQLHPISLDLSTSQHRVTIHGIDQIMKYIRSNILEDTVTIIEKKNM